jgi:hypothetical protein
MSWYIGGKAIRMLNANKRGINMRVIKSRDHLQKIKRQGWALCLKPVILGTWEAETGSIVVEYSLGK